MGWPFKQKNKAEEIIEKEMSEPNLVNSAIDIIKTIYDPEIPVNIYDMGLIYEVNLDEEKNISVIMTLYFTFLSRCRIITC